jgi:hypothetical protein
MAAQSEQPESPWFSSLKSMLGMGKPKSLEDHQQQLRQSRPTLAQELPGKMAVSSKKLNTESLNEVHKVKLHDGTTGYFKPQDDEQSTQDKLGTIHYNHGTQTDREIATYKVAEALGLHDLVPATAKTSIDVHGKGKTVPGSIQEEVKGDHGFEATGRLDKPTQTRAALFDLLIGNYDRHHNNYFVDKQNHVHLIDNGLAFPDTDDKHRYWGFKDQMLNGVLHEQVPEYVHQWAQKGPQIAQAMKAAGMSDGAIKNMQTRLDGLEKSVGKKVVQLSYPLEDGKIFRPSNLYNERRDPHVWDADKDPEATTDKYAPKPEANAMTSDPGMSNPVMAMKAMGGEEAPKKEAWQMTKAEFRETLKAKPGEKNIVFRGEDAVTGAKSYRQGKGAYFTTSKEEAAGYGEVHSYPTDAAKPKNPLKLRSEEAWDGWLINEAVNKLGLRDVREFNKIYKDPGEYVKSLGYDGVEIGMGRNKTYVNYNFPHHQKQVEQAIQQGKPVPPEVLAEYQDLAR